MKRTSFGRKVGFAFALMVALMVVVGLICVVSLRAAVESKDRVIAVNTRVLLDTERLRTLAEREVAAARRFLLVRPEDAVERFGRARSEFLEVQESLRGRIASAESHQRLAAVERAATEHHAAGERIMAMRRTDATIDAVARVYDSEVTPLRDKVEELLAAFSGGEAAELAAAQTRASEAASSSVALAVAIIAIAAIFALIVALVLTGTLSRQISTSVSHVRSSSTELQAAANQQAMGARSQASAVTEISTTITELLATSRQISESARRVSQIAEQTAAAASSGQRTVGHGSESIASIRQQVDVIVGHMLELGRKSQQIGGVLEMVSELAEQTNILAINATIEAAGAGEAGRRFAVVADEIRRLAERVTGSTKEIRALIEDVRGAVNTTVMATETGSKTVDAGLQQFATMATSFTNIAGMVATTTEAAREIELSTKQQTTAVEQVHLAIANVEQATHETEATSTQTLQTVAQLTSLSGDLMDLVQPEARA